MLPFEELTRNKILRFFRIISIIASPIIFLFLLSLIENSIDFVFISGVYISVGLALIILNSLYKLLTSKDKIGNITILFFAINIELILFLFLRNDLSISWLSTDFLQVAIISIGIFSGILGLALLVSSGIRYFMSEIRVYILEAQIEQEKRYLDFILATLGKTTEDVQ